MNEFIINSDDKVLKGIEFNVSEPKANLLVFTGMDEHSDRYTNFATELNKHNINVSILDHFGQGKNISDLTQLQKVPKGSWDYEIKALFNKVQELKKNGKPTYLMGHSMGSFSVQCYIERYSNTVSGVIIMGTNGNNNKFMINIGRILSKICASNKKWDKQANLMEKASLGPFIKAIKNRETDLDWLSYNKENVKNYLADPLSGAPNTNGFYYEMMYGLSTLYKKSNLNNISKDENILIVSGKDDPVGACSKGPISLYKLYKSLGIKNVKINIYDNMRHEILNETKSFLVIKDILGFVK